MMTWPIGVSQLNKPIFTAEVRRESKTDSCALAPKANDGWRVAYHSHNYLSNVHSHRLLRHEHAITMTTIKTSKRHNDISSSKNNDESSDIDAKGTTAGLRPHGLARQWFRYE
ncbi:hypothetical protein BBOMB_0391 [Bifidobacterium bombi DSM 19703]|uniref:Uncharacterized protein n=1 Tax=Bifidobacterium bombi DSM 19703 TaxID=1341695 RepID=A0A080N458_9BIFI|nr:hypothetical protein BBOMB_0391 [Bifidobacterium bombi DSM 19703]